jgi:hypothetical protein
VSAPALSPVAQVILKDALLILDDASYPGGTTGDADYIALMTAIRDEAHRRLVKAERNAFLAARPRDSADCMRFFAARFNEVM